MAAEETKEVRFPLAGIDQSFGFGRQPNLPTAVGTARTTVSGLNVRAFEPATGRGRGGQRPGLSDYISGPVNGDNVHVQELQQITTTWFLPGNDEGGSAGGVGTIPGSDAALPVFAIDGVTVTSGSRVVWNVRTTVEDVKSYSVALVTRNAGAEAVLVAGAVAGQEIVLMEDGQEAVARIAFPGLASDRNAVVTAVPLGQFFYFFGTAADGSLVGKSVDNAGGANWANANIGATSDLGSDTADPAFVCNDGTTAFVNLVGTGIVAVTLATGAAATPFVRCTNAALTTAAGNRYRNAGQCVTNGTVIAVLVATEASPAVYGVVYVNAATGVATAVQLGLVTVDRTYPWPDFSGETYLQTNGTDFFLMRYHFERNAVDGYKYSRVWKLDGTTGAVLEFSEDLPVSMKAIGYGSFEDFVFVSSAYTLLAADLSVAGGGVTPSFNAFYDGGSYTATGLFAGGGAADTASNFNSAAGLLAVAGGTVKVAYNGLWTATTNGSGALDIDMKVIRSTVLNGKVYFADTVNWKRYDAYTNTVEAWTASAGTLPVDARNNLPKLIVTWRGRILLAGFLFDPQNIFMSKVGDATDWDQSPASRSRTNALELNASELGKVGDVVTCLIPYSDDELIIGCAASIWLLRGDPLFGGHLDRVSDSVGMAFGITWCRDPSGKVYFMSSQAQIYSMVPGEKPQQESYRIQRLLNVINLDATVVRLGWNESRSEVMVFVTLWGLAQPATHYCYEVRSGAWWLDRFAVNSMNPLCILQWSGVTARDRGLLIGSWDGTVRMLDDDAPNDDGHDIESDVLWGPFLSNSFDELMLREIQAILGTGTSSIRWDVYAGETAEEAVALGSRGGGVWEDGRSSTDPIRVSGYAIYVRTRANRPWASEALRARVVTLGPSRARDKRV